MINVVTENPYFLSTYRALRGGYPLPSAQGKHTTLVSHLTGRMVRFAQYKAKHRKTTMTAMSRNSGKGWPTRWSSPH